MSEGPADGCVKKSVIFISVNVYISQYKLSSINIKLGRISAFSIVHYEITRTQSTLWLNDPDFLWAQRYTGDNLNIVVRGLLSQRNFYCGFFSAFNFSWILFSGSFTGAVTQKSKYKESNLNEGSHRRWSKSRGSRLRFIVAACN